MDILVFFAILIAPFATLGQQGGPNDTVEIVEEPAVDAPLTTRLTEAEDQTPTGKFTTATEVKPILSMTKQSWVAVRDYDGQDFVYFTNLLAWRCGLLTVQYAVNDGPLEWLHYEPCYDDEATPNALKMEGFVPYIILPQGSVESLRVVVEFDDLSSDEVTVSRKDVLMP